MDVSVIGKYRASFFWFSVCGRCQSVCAAVWLRSDSASPQVSNLLTKAMNNSVEKDQNLAKNDCRLDILMLLPFLKWSLSSNWCKCNCMADTAKNLIFESCSSKFHIEEMALVAQPHLRLFRVCARAFTLAKSDKYLNVWKFPHVLTQFTMSDQSQDFSDVHFTSSNSLPSSPALVPTRPVSPCSPVARPNFLPRLRTPLAVTQAVKENAKGHNVSTPPDT